LTSWKSRIAITPSWTSAQATGKCSSLSLREKSPGKYSNFSVGRFRSMKLRTLVLVLAAIGIPLALLVLVLPITWGYGGYFYAPTTARASVIVVADRNGPAYAAGVRVGQELFPPTGAEAIREYSGPVGTVAHIHTLRHGKEKTVDVTFVPYTGPLRVQQLIQKFIDALTALVAFIIALLVLLRAKDAVVGSRAAAVLVLAGCAALSQGGALVCGNAFAGFILSRSLPGPIMAGTLWAALSLLAIYPPEKTRIRRLLVWGGAWAMFAALMDEVAGTLFSMQGHVPQFLLIFFGRPNGAYTLPGMLSWFALIAACIDAMAKARDSYAPAVRWLCSLWLLSVAFIFVQRASVLSGLQIFRGHYGDVLFAGFVACLALGVAYPVLRHRMVDLNILVSRATIFTAVSLIIVGLFVGAEWAIGKLFERSLGFSNESGGLAANVIMLGVVLALGISARSIHAFVHDRLTKVFFRARLKALCDIEETAHEVDVATSARAVIDITVATILRCLDPLGVALYLHDGNRYERLGRAGSLEFPKSFDYNDVAPLKLRRWLKPCEIEDSGEEYTHTLFLPMLVRGDLVGFIACGPKRDHTVYLSDEISASVLLAHHAGLAQALLSSTSSLPSLTLG
jgi:hypothetical protein